MRQDRRPITGLDRANKGTQGGRKGPADEPHHFIRKMRGAIFEIDTPVAKMGDALRLGSCRFAFAQIGRNHLGQSQRARAGTRQRVGEPGQQDADDQPANHCHVGQITLWAH